jgi:F0F1-type ATP synthase epsilon subunit
MIIVKICYNDRFKDYECDTIIINTKSGVIGIMENHENLTTQLNIGYIKMLNKDKQLIEEIFVNSGLLQFNNQDNSCIITLLK